MKTNRNFIKIFSVIMLFAIMVTIFVFSDEKDRQEEVVKETTNLIRNMTIYEMSDNEIKELPSIEIKEQSEEQENAQEQEVEDEGFELQGEIAYEGDRARTWNVELGDYKGLTYYSQIDSRWSNKMYSSLNNQTQTVGSSGCGPTCASMIVTATKGAITPDRMSDLFVQYGYRSSNNGTYWSAFRAVADEFNIGYIETSDINGALQLLKKNHYLVASCGNGLFTTGGHFIVLTKLDGNTIEVYDPYLYAGKFETSTRRGKAIVNGNVVYVTVENFKAYANAQRFFCYTYDGSNVAINQSQPVVTANYTRYVNAKTGLNIRNTPNGRRIGGLSYGAQVSVLETSGNWSRIHQGWVSSEYLVSTTPSIQTQNIMGRTKKLSSASILYSNPNLTGFRYCYKANTTITILQHISSVVDKIRVNQTGRVAYINNKNYSDATIITVGQYKRLKRNTILYSNSNLSGTRYHYLPQTQLKIIRNISSEVDYVYIIKTGRYAYVKNDAY